MKVAIIKYNGGNTCSIMHALDRLGVEYELTDKSEAITSADKVIFPGVGEASSTMSYLRSNGLDKVICGLKQPTLGICLGQQLMCRSSEEGDTECLGIFDVPVRRFRPANISEKVPHMGWNSLSHCRSGMFDGIADGTFVYFVHSFYVPVCQWTAAETDYITPFSSALHRDNFHATQFHPEKSGKAGSEILSNFLNL